MSVSNSGYTPALQKPPALHPLTQHTQSQLQDQQHSILRQRITNSGSQCPHCRRIYANAEAVERHIKKYCLKEKRFGCIFCQYRSKRKDHIVRHTKRVHNNELQEKIDEGMITNPLDAVLQDFKTEDGDIQNNSTDNALEMEDDDMDGLDFQALYPEVSETEPPEIMNNAASDLRIKTEHEAENLSDNY